VTRCTKSNERLRKFNSDLRCSSINQRTLEHNWDIQYQRLSLSPCINNREDVSGAQASWYKWQMHTDQLYDLSPMCIMNSNLVSSHIFLACISSEIPKEFYSYFPALGAYRKSNISKSVKQQTHQTHLVNDLHYDVVKMVKCLVKMDYLFSCLSLVTYSDTHGDIVPKFSVFHFQVKFQYSLEVQLQSLSYSLVSGTVSSQTF